MAAPPLIASLPSRALDGLAHGLVPLDRARSALYRVAAPYSGPWIRDRHLRAGLHATSVVLLAAAGALLAPLWLLALGPIALGVPHLVADVRYLVVQPGLHRRRGAVLLGGLLLASSIAVDLRFGIAAAALAPWVLARASWLRRAVASAPLLALWLTATLAYAPTAVISAHAHNLVAVVAWVALGVALHGGTRGWASALPLLGAAAFAAALLVGAVDPWLGAGPSLPGAPDVATHAAALAPGLSQPAALRWVLAFAFAQAVHYGLWLRVIPEVGRRRPAPRTWRASLAALRRDLGDPALALALLVFGGIALWATADLAAARDGYLRLALFHGPLELAVLAVALAEGPSALRRP